MGKSKDDAVSAAEEMEKLLLQSREYLSRIKKIMNEMSAMDKKMDKLFAYYHGQWLADQKKKASKSERHYEIFDEDSIYEVEQQYFALRLQLLKKLAASLINVQ